MLLVSLGMNSYYFIVVGTLFETKTYGCTVRASLGKKAGYTSMFLCFLLNFGSSIVGLQVIGHGSSDILMTVGVSNPGFMEIIGFESLCIIVVAGAFVLPLSLLRNVVSLPVLSNEIEYIHTYTHALLDS